MWAIVRRAVLPGLLLIGGLGSLIYGAMFHTTTVIVSRETETTIDVPLPPARPFGEMPPGEAVPFPGRGTMGGGPAVVKKTVKRTEFVPVEMLEPPMIFDVTIGGLVLSESGEIKRTYSGKAGPALCPT